MKNRVLIVDSYEKQIDRIASEVYEAANEMSLDVKLYAAKSLHEAQDIMVRTDIDLLILDTIYTETSVDEKPGINWVEQLRTEDKYIPLPVVFVSSEEKHWKYAYMELNCLGYFSRDYEQEELRKAIKKGLHYRTYGDDEKYILLKNKTMIYPVRIKDIVYAELLNRVMYLHLKDGTELEIPRKALGELQEQLACREVVQCNKSTLVNTRYIQKTEHAGEEIVLDLEMGSLHVGRKFKQPIETALYYKAM